MAGIGWRLERLIHRGISGATAAYATGAAVMALPWVLTTAVLASLPAVIDRSLADATIAKTAVNVAYAVALLVAGPIQIVISRYTADRLYEGRLHAIAAPFCRGLATTFLICAVPAALALLALGLPLRIALCGAALSAAVGAQWTALSVGNGLCSPGLVLGAVGAGSALSFLLAASLVALGGLGVPGYLFGLIWGQTLTLVIVLIGIFRALPDEANERARLLPAFRDYATLAGAGLAFNASLWVDKLVAWCLVGGETAALHAGASTIAWFSTIPCLAWIFVEVETTFHRRFRAFYVELEGGASLAELRRGVRALMDEAARLLRGAVSVQAGVIVFLQLAADPWARWLGLPADAILPYRLLLIGAGAQALGLLGLILLYYFDLRREACFAASGLLLSSTAFTVAASASGLPPSVGTALGCSLGAILTWLRVFRGISEVLQQTLLGQPFGAERSRSAGAARVGPAPLRQPTTRSYGPNRSFRVCVKPGVARR
jgi:polysaccharide biosynthesis protein PelG